MIGRLLDVLLGPKCRLGCGERVFPKDWHRHFYLEHGGRTW